MKGVLMAVVVLFAGLSSAQAQEQTFSSGHNQVNLIELYTSEGCSSCPPADEWLSSFKADPRLWKQLIPIAFHVDYWDYIGWKDPYADSAFSVRQRDYANSGYVNSVYTPGVIVNGREWRGKTPISSKNPEVGQLDISINKNVITANFKPKRHSQDGGELNLTVAVLGFDLSSDVQSGENRGRVLTHDFVVLGHKQAALVLQGDHYEVESVLPMAKIKAKKTAVVAWVTQQQDLTPIQAVGGWLQ